MKLILNSKDFTHIKENSAYNHNYYKYTGKDNTPVVILEICHEDDVNFTEYHLVKDGRKTFLGCSNDSIDTNNIVTIDFQLFYT